MAKMLCAFLLSVILAIGFAADSASAHDVGYEVINSAIVARENTLVLHTEVPRQSPFILFTQDTQHDAFEAYVNKNFTLTNRGKSCPFTLGAFDTKTAPDRILYDGVYTCESIITTVKDLTIHAPLFREYIKTFDHFVTITIGESESRIIFSSQAFEYPAQTSAESIDASSEHFLEIAKQFVQMGMMHIWTGYDHILFLLSVILLVRSLKKILLLVTAFTIAHSITLIAASYYFIYVPPIIVEPLIALSIIYIALRNIFTLYKNEEMIRVGERWATTFGFGLVHGLGFASALAATTIPQDFFVPSLVVFNIGIEIGQLAILVLAIPFLLWLDTQPYARKSLLVFSVILCALAAFWFVERVI